MISSDLRRFGPPEATELNTEGEQGRVHLQYQWQYFSRGLAFGSAAVS